MDDREILKEQKSQTIWLGFKKQSKFDFLVNLEKNIQWKCFQIETDGLSYDEKMKMEMPATV